MARILPDRDIQKLLGKVILHSDPGRINPNGVEIRLGRHVLFQSTDEEKQLGDDSYLKVLPGESVIISSLERFDLRRETVQEIFPGCELMALVTPTTTMMREGILQPATKVDSGWSGNLNWGLRNSSVRDFIIGCGEPIFKLTFFLLDENEVPDIPYGERPDDRYQNTEGIARSTRKAVVNVPKSKVVSSSFGRLDPNKQLREAGYPFDHIGRELTELHGKWEVVSKDVMLLGSKITDETKKISDKVEESQKTSLDKVESLFQRKFLQICGMIVGSISLMFGVVTFLKTRGISGILLAWVAFLAAFAIYGVIFFLTRRNQPS